jgi:hypothetical protein
MAIAIKTNSLTDKLPEETLPLRKREGPMQVVVTDEGSKIALFKFGYLNKPSKTVDVYVYPSSAEINLEFLRDFFRERMISSGVMLLKREFGIDFMQLNKEFLYGMRDVRWVSSNFYRGTGLYFNEHRYDDIYNEIIKESIKGLPSR